MNDSFDPYYTWLGIPPAEQPPNHYRLLGIQLYEPNPDVIAHAADRQMMHLRSFQNGAHSALSQRLLNEVAAARICLHDAAKKPAYDAQLRNLLNPPSPLPRATPLPLPIPHAAPVVLNQPARRPAPHTQGLSWLSFAKFGVGGLVILMIVVMGLQYATGVDLLGWGTKPKTGKAPGANSTSQASLPKVPQAKRQVAVPTASKLPAKTPPSTPVQPEPTSTTLKPAAPELPTPKPPENPPSAPGPAAVASAPTEIITFDGPNLPKKAAIKILLNNVREDGRVILEEQPVPPIGAWAIAGKELFLTSTDSMKNTAVAISSSAKQINEVRIQARTFGNIPSSVRLTCGNVYAILNWEEQNENHILIGGRRAEVSTPHCLTKGKVHEIVLQQQGDKVRIMVDEKEVIAAKGGILDSGVHIASSTRGTIGVRSVKMVSGEAIALPSTGSQATSKNVEPQQSLPRPSSLKDSLGMEMVVIAAGEFQMGNDESLESLTHAFPPFDKQQFADAEARHSVRITKEFYLGKYEVTVGQFKKFVDGTGYKTEPERDGKGGFGFISADQSSRQKTEFSWRNAGFPQGDNHPVVNVTWNDAQAFCKWLSKLESAVYRLPTEAEWEYACRAGTTTRYSCGNDPERLASVGNVADATVKDAFRNWTTIVGWDGFLWTAPVGSLKPNGFGLCDMHGNVWEWCADWYQWDYYKKSPQDDPQGPKAGSVRILRGGGWRDYTINYRSAYRGQSAPTLGYYNNGFRVVREF